MKKLNLFISYSHCDEKYIERFRQHFSPLINDQLINIWYDREILPGQELKSNIDNNIQKSDIICLFISADFLASESCIGEKKEAIKLKEKNDITIIPIILSPCGWKDDESISSLLALPKDGKEISSYKNHDDAWKSVYEGLKPVISLESEIKSAKITEQFMLFLENTGMLTKAHPRKERVVLEDIFIYPRLKKYNELREFEKNESSENLINNFFNYSKVLIAGASQSGKTTLCKKIFLTLRDKNYFPVYVSDKNIFFFGKLDKKISSAFSEQYKGVSFDKLKIEKIIPIIDNFHFAKHKEKIIQSLSNYPHQVIVVDDIFSLNIKDENIIQDYTHFEIEELIPSLRNKLIEKWVHLNAGKRDNENSRYQIIDKTTELVDTSLGKAIGSGIMPAYPFFILTIISTRESFGKSLDQEITSQGYFYQALIYLYLRKEGVNNEDIDTYTNFLTEISFFIYAEKKTELSDQEFNTFMTQYLDKYNLTIKKKTLLDKLKRAQMITNDSCGNYCFCYRYLYYFFVARYLSDHLKDKDQKKIVDKIIENLHKEENSYIVIFISHHSRNPCILDEITLNACILFEKYDPATLNKSEVQHLDNQVDKIGKELLSTTTATPEKERARRLEIQDKEDQLATNDTEKDCQDNDDFEVEIRRSIKTVEVMGQIIKNHAGSLEKKILEDIFEKAMKVHLRILTSFFGLIKHGEKEIINFISNRINKISEDKEELRKSKRKKIVNLSGKKLEKLSKNIFWNINFFFMYALIDKTIHSLGSDKLTEVIEKICDKEDTPVAFLVKHGILMWYNKNIQINNIVEVIGKDNFSETAKKIMRGYGYQPLRYAPSEL